MTASIARPRRARRLVLKLLAIGGGIAWAGRGASAAEAVRWWKPTLGWSVMAHPLTVSHEQFVSQCAIAFSRWHMVTGLRFEFGGADITFHMSNQLPEWTSARAEMPSLRGETRTCNVWLNSKFIHTLHDEERNGPYCCDLAYELLHEIGHVLGFEHTHRAGSIMRSSLEYPFVRELDSDDTALARARYGVASPDPLRDLFIPSIFK